MNPQYFVEIVSRAGDVLERHPVAALPIRIGRAYDNHIIINDPHIAAHHARVDQAQNGGLILRDLDSRNGLVYKRKRLREVALNGDTIVRLGHTSLRVRSRAHAVAAELADSTNHLWEGWLPAIIGLLLMAAQALFSQWLGQTSQVDTLAYLVQVATQVGVLLLWSGGWALTNRVFSGQMRFGRHVFIAAGGMVVSEAWYLVSMYLANAFSLEFFTRYNNLFDIAIFSAMLFFHLATVSPRHSKRIFLVMFLLAAAASCLSLVNNYQRHDRLAGELYMGEILPPNVRQSRNHSLEEFINSARKIQPKLDKARTENMPEKDEKGLVDILPEQSPNN